LAWRMTLLCSVSARYICSGARLNMPAGMMGGYKQQHARLFMAGSIEVPLQKLFTTRHAACESETSTFEPHPYTPAPTLTPDLKTPKPLT
jgi:hypothetical protein